MLCKPSNRLNFKASSPNSRPMLRAKMPRKMIANARCCKCRASSPSSNNRWCSRDSSSSSNRWFNQGLRIRANNHKLMGKTLDSNRWLDRTTNQSQHSSNHYLSTIYRRNLFNRLSLSSHNSNLPMASNLAKPKRSNESQHQATKAIRHNSKCKVKLESSSPMQWARMRLKSKGKCSKWIRQHLRSQQSSHNSNRPTQDRWWLKMLGKCNR